jgi:SAM-dependent methyltransferase
MMLMEELKDLAVKPPLFQKIGSPIWTDPHICKQLLACHLDLSHDAASRTLETINNTISFLTTQGYIKPGDNLLDLGCGPGLYAEQLAKAHVNVTGVDISETSIAYAKESAKKQGLDIDYHVLDFLNLSFDNTFDVAMQIYGELNVFSPQERDQLLHAIHQSLKTNGLFIFDVTTRHHRLKQDTHSTWYMSENEFWSKEKALVLETHFDYPEASTWLDQYIVVSDHTHKVFRNWFLDYSKEDIVNVLRAAGFEAIAVMGDLEGSPFNATSEWIGIIAQKR